MQVFMNKLPKKYTCECGRVKKIKWENAKEFKSGLCKFAIGHSKCNNPKCNVIQVHYSGDPYAIQDFINSVEYSEFESNLGRPFH